MLSTNTPKRLPSQILDTDLSKSHILPSPFIRVLPSPFLEPSPAPLPPTALLVRDSLALFILYSPPDTSA